MNKQTKIDKLNLERKILLFEFNVALENLEREYNSKLSKIDNKLSELTRIGFVIPTKKSNENKKNTSKLRSS